MEHEDLYLISEHLREGCTRCPFCYSYALDRSMVDETKIGVMLQQMTCRDCGADWTVEYEASRVRYGSKWYSRYEYWPTYTQVKNIKYQERFAAKHGIKNPWRPDIEEIKDDAVTIDKKKSVLRKLVDRCKYRIIHWP